jgi:hypothetical protein
MEEEFAGLDFHLLRLEERFMRTMETFYKQPGNENFEREEIIKTHREATLRRMAGYGGTILTVRIPPGLITIHA